MTEDHCLRIIKYCLESHNLTGIAELLNDNCEYFSTTFGVRASNASDTVSSLNGITQRIVADWTEVFCHIMRIGAIPDENCLYRIGKKGLLLSYGETDSYACAFFIEMGENEKISRLVSSVEKYSFALEKNRFIPDAESSPFRFRNVTLSEKDWLEFIGVWLENGIVDKDSFFETLDDSCVVIFRKSSVMHKFSNNADIRYALPKCMNLYFKSGAHIVFKNDKAEIIYGKMSVKVEVDHNLLRRMIISVSDE